MADKPTIPDFPTLPDFGKMITQACEVVASVRGIPYDFNGTLSLENKFVVLFKTVKEMFDAQDELVKSYKALYDFINNYFSNLDVQEEINKKIENMAKTGELTTLILPYIKASPVIVNTKEDMTNHECIYLLKNDGYLYYWNGSSFAQSGINYTFPVNSFVFHTYRFMTSDNKISDLNECGSYAIGVKDSTNIPSDMPPGLSSGNFLVVVDGYIGGNNTTFRQTFYSASIPYYYERTVKNGNGVWYGNGEKYSFVAHDYTNLTPSEKISDFISVGTYSFGIVNPSDAPADMPGNWKNGLYLLSVLGYFGGNRKFVIQTMYNFSSAEVYTRRISDSIGEWESISRSNKIKVALCGDSFIAAGGDGGLPMGDYLNYYSKYNATTLAKGGIKASEWLSTFSTKINATYDVFLISLGLNGESNDEIYKDSIKNIITNINAVNPTARIILWCMDAWFPENYSAICEEISKNFGIEFYSMKAMSNIPIRIDGKYPDKFPALDSKFVTAKTNAYTISAADHHPNINGRKLLAEFWSTII